MTVRDAYLYIKHIFNLDDSYKSSFTHWLKMFEDIQHEDKRVEIAGEMISWMENSLYMVISDHSKRRIISMAEELYIPRPEVKPGPVVTLPPIKRMLKQMDPDKGLLDDVAKEICERHGITISDLKERTRKGTKVSIMKSFIREAVMRHSFSDEALADYLGINRTTVIYHRNDGVLKAKKRRYQRMKSI